MVGGNPSWEALPSSTIPSGSTGSLLYYSATNTLAPLAPGANTYVLTLAGGIPTWMAPVRWGWARRCRSARRVT